MIGLGPPGVSNSQNWSHCATSVLSVTIWIFCTKAQFPSVFYAQGSLLQEACICLSVFSVLGAAVCTLPSPLLWFGKKKKKIVGFLVYSVFHLLEQNGDFQAPST